MPTTAGSGERYNSTGRGPADPQEWKLDLKHSLWTIPDGSWSDRAPLVWRAIWEGIVEGKLDEHGETLIIHTSPSKETRWGQVIFRSHGDPELVEVDVSFRAEGDDEEALMQEDAFVVMADEEGFDEAMRRIDRAEELLIKGEEA